MPSEITEQLYVTDIRDARTCDKDDFDAVVTVCQDSIEANVPDDIDYHYYCMADGEETGLVPGDSSYDMFEDAARIVLAHLRFDDTVLLHCHAGQSRSVSVGMAAIMVADGFTFEEAWTRMANRRPEVHPDRTLKQYARRFASEQMGGG